MLAKTLGTQPGWPDLCVVGQGWIRYLEVKKPGGRVSPNQLLVHGWLRERNIMVDVVYSLDDVIGLGL